MVKKLDRALRDVTNKPKGASRDLSSLDAAMKDSALHEEKSIYFSASIDCQPDVGQLIHKKSVVAPPAPAPAKPAEAPSPAPQPQATPARVPTPSSDSPEEIKHQLALFKRTQRDMLFYELKHVPKRCNYYTGERDWEMLINAWEIANLSGVWNLPEVFGDTEGGRRKMLTPFQCWVCGLVLFKRFRGRGLQEEGARTTGLSDASARTIYEKFVGVTEVVADEQMPDPSYEQICAMTSTTTRCRMRMGPKDGSLNGDCELPHPPFDRLRSIMMCGHDVGVLV